MLNRTFFCAIGAVTVIVSVLLALLPTVAPTADAVTVAGNSFALRDVRVFDGEQIIKRANVVVRDGLVTALAPDAPLPDDLTVLDSDGQTLLPGLIDAHTHTFGNALTMSLRFGVTTTLDMFTGAQALVGKNEARARLARTDRADLFSAGMLATAAGGHGTQFGLPVETLATPDEASAWVARRKAERSDYIKLVYIVRQNKIASLDLATASAVIAAAHEQGLLAVAHIGTQSGARDMIEAGIDGLVHVFADEPVSAELAALAARKGVFVIPTLGVLAAVDGRPLGKAFAADDRIRPYLGDADVNNLGVEMAGNWPGFEFDLGLQNTAALHAAGVRIVAGSDARNPGTVYGASIHHELELLVRGGLTPLEALRAATSAAADAFTLPGRGRIAVGARADLVLIAGDPLHDITASRAIVAIFKNGYVLERSKPLREAPAIGSATLGDFDTDLQGPDGLLWAPTSDGMMGGQSEARVSHDSAAGGVLRVDASVRDGFIAPWAGAYFGVAPGGDAVRSLAAYTRLNFRVRGTAGTYRVMMFNEAQAGAPPMQSFDVNDDWRDVSLELAAFDSFVTTAFTGLAIVAGPRAGEFVYLVDSVRLE